MQNFIQTIKKYAVYIADIVFIIGAVTTALNTFVRAVDEHYPAKDSEKK